MISAVIESLSCSNGRHGNASAFNRLIKQGLFDVIGPKILPPVGLLAEPVKQLLADITNQMVLAERGVAHSH